MRYSPRMRSRWLDISWVLFTFLWTEMKSRFVRTEKKIEANIQWSWRKKLGQWGIYYIAKGFCFIKNPEWLVYSERLEESKLFCSTINPPESFMSSLFWLSSTVFRDPSLTLFKNYKLSCKYDPGNFLSWSASSSTFSSLVRLSKTNLI